MKKYIFEKDYSNKKEGDIVSSLGSSIAEKLIKSGHLREMSGDEISELEKIEAEKQAEVLAEMKAQEQDKIDKEAQKLIDQSENLNKDGKRKAASNKGK